MTSRDGPRGDVTALAGGRTAAQHELIVVAGIVEEVIVRELKHALSAGRYQFGEVGSVRR